MLMEAEHCPLACKQKLGLNFSQFQGLLTQNLGGRSQSGFYLHSDLEQHLRVVVHGSNQPATSHHRLIEPMPDFRQILPIRHRPAAGLLANALTRHQSLVTRD